MSKIKVTLTDRGVEFCNQLIRETKIQSPNTAPHLIYSMKTQRAATSSRTKQQDLLDSLLPALISADPPQKVSIRQPQVNISRRFLNKYLNASNKLYASNPNASRSGIQMQYLKRPPKNIVIDKTTLNLASLKKDPFLKTFYSSTNCTKPTRSKEIRITENMANLLIASTLKSQRIKDRLRELSKHRVEMGVKRHVTLCNIQQRESALQVANPLEDEKELQEVVLVKRNDKERYLERVSKKHKEMAIYWQNMRRLQYLCSRKSCRIPYEKLKLLRASHTKENEQTSQQLTQQLQQQTFEGLGE